MQTTLLGLAIAFIIALITALVGPFFIDWNQFRPQFEAEASRILGTSVRVGGELDARLLPAPSLRLHSVVFGGPNDISRLQAAKLDVEFSLGSLMRGEWRATELTLNGVSADVGLDARGQLELPMLKSELNLAALAIDKLNVTGRIALHNAARRATVELNDIAFSGDVRSFPGSMRGAGNFMLNEQRYPFRLSTGSTADNSGTRLHLALESNASGVSVDIDGTMMIDKRMPKFDGSVVVARSASKARAVSGEALPWKLTSRTKADHDTARLDQLEISVGPDDNNIKLTGTADIKYGSASALRAALTARQFDADKLLGRPVADQPEGLLPAFGRLVAELPAAVMPTRIELAADQIMLGGRAVQKLELDVRGDTDAWTLQRLDLRAPGATRVTASGTIGYETTGAVFEGPLAVDSADPDTLTAWLQGRTEFSYRSQKPMKLRGELNLGRDQLALTDMNAEVDGSVIAGHVRINGKTPELGSRFDAELKAQQLDLDSFAEFIRSLGGPKQEWPQSARVSVNIDQAQSAGQMLRPFIAQFSYTPEEFTLDRIRIGNATSLMLDGQGAFNRKSVAGSLLLNGRSASLATISDMLKPFAPEAMARLAPVTQLPGAAELRLTMDLGRQSDAASDVVAKAALSLNSPQLDMNLNLTALPGVKELQTIDLATVIQSGLSLDSVIETSNGQAVLDAAGLGHVIAAGPGRVRFAGDAKGSLHKPIRISANLKGSDIDADLAGSIDISGVQPTSDVQLNVRKVSVGPTVAAPGQARGTRQVSLASRVFLSSNGLAFTNIDSLVDGSRVRGKIILKPGNDKVVSGDLNLDVVQVGPMLSMIAGLSPAGDAASRNQSAPLGAGLVAGWRGELEFQAARAMLPGGLTISTLKGQLNGATDGIVLRKLSGKLAGGDVSGDFEVRHHADGHALHAHLNASKVNGAALSYGDISLPQGTLSLMMSLSGKGRSASALIGSLSGEGLLDIEGGRLAGLDADVFPMAVKASDDGKLGKPDVLQKLVSDYLAKGNLPIGNAQVPFVISNGRMQVNALALDSEKAKVSMSGGFDITDQQFDLRATLVDKDASQSVAPEVIVFVSGKPDRTERVVDVSGLTAWLGWRSIERETRRLEALQRDTAAIASAQAVKPQDNVEDSNKDSASGRVDSKPQINPVPDVASSDVEAIVNPPLPHPDPRRAALDERASERRDGVTVSAPAAAAPLPAPIDVLPAPGESRTPRPRPQAPLVIAPTVPRTAPHSNF